MGSVYSSTYMQLGIQPQTKEVHPTHPPPLPQAPHTTVTVPFVYTTGVAPPRSQLYYRHFQN